MAPVGIEQVQSVLMDVSANATEGNAYRRLTQ